MLIISGCRRYGQIDSVPGVCHVTTRFFHLYYIPLIPLSSWVIVQKSKSIPATERRIRLSLTSVLCGWIYAYLLLYGLFTLLCSGARLMVLTPGASNAFDLELSFALGLCSLSAWILVTIRPLRAGRRRANELRSLLGMELEPDAEFEAEFEAD